MVDIGDSISADQFEPVSAEDAAPAQTQYESPDQTTATAIEGATRGILGPLAGAAEHQILGTPKEDILAREKANPTASTLGEIGGFLTGFGESGAIGEAGEAATKGLGLAEKALPEAFVGPVKPMSAFKQIGSPVAKLAVENALMTGGSKIDKLLLNDPETSVESAIADVGISAALGGALGGVYGGTKELWKATAGKKLGSVLNDLVTHFDGNAVNEQAVESAKSLGIPLDDLQKGIYNTAPRVRNQVGIAMERGQPEILDAIDRLKTDVQDKVSNSLGIKPESVLKYDKNEAGHDVMDTLEKEFKAKHEPFENRFEARNEEANAITASDEDLYDHYGKMMERAQNRWGTDAPEYKLYQDYGNRILSRSNLGKLDQLATDIGNKAYDHTVDNNTKLALQDIHGMLRDFQENQILKQSKELENQGVEYGSALGRDVVKERNELHADWKAHKNTMNEIAGNLGIKNFAGKQRFLTRLKDITPEQLLNKLSPKNNADIIPFLQKYFPETAEHIRQNEARNILKQSFVKGAKNQETLDVSSLTEKIAGLQAGEQTYLNFVMPKQAQDAVNHAANMLNAIPKPKSSGTAGWIHKIFGGLPSSVGAVIGLVTGHNPLVAGGVAQISNMVQNGAQDAGRLAFIKFMSKDAPVSPEAYKTMTNYYAKALKFNNNLAKATKNIFIPSAEVLSAHLHPVQADRDKLQASLDKYTDESGKFEKDQANNDLGHYLPEHQTAHAMANTRALQYLKQIEPKPIKPGPLDPEINPTPQQIARYQRAQDIAQQPLIVLHHAKEGTLQPSDIQDFQNMYPKLYPQMVSQIVNNMNAHAAAGNLIPYKTKMGVSLLTGQEIDASMQPQNIQAAQPQPAPQPNPQKPVPKKAANGSKQLQKLPNSYRTSTQTAESDRSDRD